MTTIQNSPSAQVASAIRATASLFSGHREERINRALSSFADTIGARYLQILPVPPEGDGTTLPEGHYTLIDSGAVDESQIQTLLTPLKSEGTVRFNLMATFNSEPDRDLGFITEMLEAFADALAPIVDLPVQMEHVEQRLRIDQALVDLSQMLVASADIDFERLLSTTGEVTGVDTAYFVRLPLNTDELTRRPASSSDSTIIYRWTRDREFVTESMTPIDATDSDAMASIHIAGVTDPESNDYVNAVPVLSSDDRLFGYLGFEYTSNPPKWRNEDVRVLGILGDMLASYFARKIAEQALLESEERWRRLVDHHPDPVLLSGDGVIRYVNSAAVRVLGAQKRADLVGASLFDFVSAGMFDVLEDRGRVLEQGGTPEPIEHEMIRFDGEERIVESAAVPIRYEGQSLNLTVMRDVTEARLAEEGYRTFVETITEGIFRVDLDRPVSREADPTLQRRHISDFGYIAECNGVMIELLAQDRSEIEGKPLSTVFPHVKSEFLDEFIRKGYRLKNKEVAFRRRRGDVRFLMVNIVGTLERGRLSRIWCSCIDVTERVEVERRIVGALEEQQQKIGRDLHDGVGQLLTGIRMLSQNLADRLVEEEHVHGDAATKISSFAVDASRHIRDIYRGLTPAQLYHEGLSATLFELAHNIDSLPNISCEFVHEDGADVDDQETKLHLFRIAQEAINNALKHADPSRILISLRHDEADLVLAIRDDGVGLAPAGGKRSSIGIESMMYRAASIGGTLQIESVEEGGTVIRCSIPLETRRDL